MPPTEIYTLSLHDALPICGTWLPMTLSKRKRSWLSGSLSTVTVASAPRLRSGMPDLSRGAEATVTVDNDPLSHDLLRFDNVIGSQVPQIGRASCRERV